MKRLFDNVVELGPVDRVARGGGGPAETGGLLHASVRVALHPEEILAKWQVASALIIRYFFEAVSILLSTSQAQSMSSS